MLSPCLHLEQILVFYGYSLQGAIIGVMTNNMLLERENIAEEVDMDCRGVIEVIANEVDDEKAKGDSNRK